MTLSRDAEATIGARIAEIDRLISLQLNEVLHHPAFQKLEATWRGIKHLLDQSETNDMLKIKLLNVSKKDLLRDLQRAPEFDQSAFFKKVYEEEFGVFGGAPFAALVGDYEFGRGRRGCGTAGEGLAGCFSGACAFPLGSCAGDDQPDRIRAVDRNPRYVKGIRQHGICQVEGLPRSRTIRAMWRSPASCSDARAVRQGYPADRRVRLRRGRRRQGSLKYLWGNAAYALAARLTQSFAKYGWCAAIRGVEGGGLVEGLATHNFRTDEGDVALKCPTEVSITDRREKELADQGFVPLVHCKGTDYAAFFSVQTATSRRCMTSPRPMRMHGFRRSCPTCWPCRGLRII